MKAPGAKTVAGEMLCQGVVATTFRRVPEIGRCVSKQLDAAVRF